MPEPTQTESALSRRLREVMARKAAEAKRERAFWKEFSSFIHSNDNARERELSGRERADLEAVLEALNFDDMDAEPARVSAEATVPEPAPEATASPAPVVSPEAASPPARARKERASSFAKMRPVSSKRRDRNARRTLPGFKHSTRSNPAAASVHTPTPATHLTKRERADTNDTRCLPQWRDTTDILKATMANRALAVFGVPLHFTLNLGESELKAVNDNAPAYLKRIGDRITRELKKAVGTAAAFWFRIEITKDGRPHLHGGIAGPVELIPAIADALRLAGGKWGHTSNSEKQVLVAPQNLVDGWTIYTEKDEKRTRDALGIERTFSATKTLRKAAKEAWEAHRLAHKGGRAASARKAASAAPKASGSPAPRPKPTPAPSLKLAHALEPVPSTKPAREDQPHRTILAHPARPSALTLAVTSTPSLASRSRYESTARAWDPASMFGRRHATARRRPGAVGPINWRECDSAACARWRRASPSRSHRRSRRRPSATHGPGLHPRHGGRVPVRGLSS